MTLAIAEFVKETYENLKQILELLCLESVAFTLPVDMKLGNVFLGLGSVASTYPSPWCETSENNFGNQAISGKLRTLAMIRFNSINFQKALSIRLKKSKLSAAIYKSCVNPPLLNLPDETKVLDTLPIMDLHLVLGITNMLFDHLINIVNQSNSCPLKATDWSNKLSINRPPMHLGEFNGNQCRHLLNNLYLLEELLESAKIGFEGGKLIAAFKTFNAVRQACFGNVLNSSYRDSLFSIERVYKVLGISITPKVHAIIKHVPGFIDNQAEKHDIIQRKLPPTQRNKNF